MRLVPYYPFITLLIFSLVFCAKEKEKRENKLGPILTISTTKIEFGEVIVGNTKSSTITLKNIGDAEVVITKIELENYSDVYFLKANISRLAPQKEARASITFKPKNVTEYNTKIIIQSNSQKAEKEIEIIASGNTLCGKCDTPPKNSCATENDLLQYLPQGICEGSTKKSAKCVYQSSSTTCEFGCDIETSQCKNDPCEGVICNTPPDSCHLAEGICNKGNCAYPVVPIGTKCDDNNVCTSEDICNNQRKCKGVPETCDKIPSAECISSNMQRVYSLPNQCDPMNGCVYPFTEETCTLGKQCITNGCNYNCQPLSPTTVKSSSNSLQARFAGNDVIGLVYSESSKKEIFLQILDKQLQTIVAETVINSATSTAAVVETADIVEHQNGFGIFWNETDNNGKSKAYYRDWGYLSQPNGNIILLSHSLNHYEIQKVLLNGSDYYIIILGRDASSNNIITIEKRNIAGQLDYQKNIASSFDDISGVSASLGNNEIIINWTVNNRIFLTIVDINGNLKTDYNPPIDVSSAYSKAFIGKSAFDGTNYNIVFKGCGNDCNTEVGFLIATFGSDGKRVFQDYPFVSGDIDESIDFLWNDTRKEFAALYTNPQDGLHFISLDIQGTVTRDASITANISDISPSIFWNEQSYMILFHREEKNIFISNQCNWDN